MIYVLYKLDQNGSGVGGPFPEFPLSQDESVNGVCFNNLEDVWATFCHEIDDLESFQGSDETVDELKNRLLSGHDVDNGDEYWQMVTLKFWWQE